MNALVRPFRNTRSTRAEIRRLAGTMPGRDLAAHLGCSYGTLRTIASEEKVSLRFGDDRDDGRPGADDRAVERIDRAPIRLVEVRALIAKDIATKLRFEAAARNMSIETLVARLVSLVAIDGIVGAVLDDAGAR